MCALALMAMCVPAMVRGADEDLRKEIDKLKKDLDAQKSEVEGLKKEKAASKAPIASAQAKVDNKYGPNANVTTKTGNDSFTIRRAELHFTMDITENVTGKIMIDPSRPLAGRPAFPTNVGLFSTGGVTAAASADVKSPAFNSGFKLFQDAFINYHGVVPHHDFTVGQYKPYIGDEGIASSAALDFCERSMLGQLGDKRDLGITAHGTWWDDRFQYWLGGFDATGDYFFSRGGDFQNRVDDNDAKDFAWRFIVRPLWKNEKWGSLEIGASGEFGRHGESGGVRGPNSPTLDGLDIQKNWAKKYGAWASYRPGGPVKGWWLKGEWAWQEDRLAPGSVKAITTAAPPAATGNGFATATAYAFPNPVHASGFYISTGYKISDSVFKDSAPGWLKNFEFAFRYEEFQNILVADLVDPNRHTDVFATDVWTGGINYYIKGNNAKIQINYNVVDNPDAGATVTRGKTGALGTATGPQRNFRAVNNNNLIVNFQVAW
ncbi:MAG: hypothetical protein HY291_15090 [Planctomycetes bacterium]|nr:hypothetical protein [Planctomycetota bacterium]